MLRRTARSYFQVLCLSYTPTGNSTGAALRQLGLLTYTCTEVFDKHAATGQDHPLKWAAILEKRGGVERAMFGDYEALVGVPATGAVESLLAIADDDVKVVLVKETHPARWQEMLRDHAWPLAGKIGKIAEKAAPFKPWHSLIKRMFPPESVDATDALVTLEAFARREVPGDRLLIHAHEDGWAPLCEFLGKPLPMRKAGVDYGDGQPAVTADGEARAVPFPDLDYGEKELAALASRFDKVLDVSARLLRLLTLATACVVVFVGSKMAGEKLSGRSGAGGAKQAPGVPQGISALVDMEEPANAQQTAVPTAVAAAPGLPSGLTRKST